MAASTAASATGPADVTHADLANAIRALSMDAVQAANSGHPGAPMGMADMATVLFRDVLNYDAASPNWPDRDRFVLSNGHGSMLLYSLLYLTGYPEMTIEEIKNFRQWGARTAGHPEYGHAPGIETTTGPLGQGLGNAVGMAMAERRMAAEFGSDLVDHHTYAFAGDGCLMEGISQEAISLAGHLKLGRLIVLFDDNGISIDGDLALASSEDQQARFAAAGWHVQAIDGHDPDAIKAALEAAKAAGDRPSMIACRTVIGYGSPNKAGTGGVHGAALGDAEIALTREKLGWPHPPFEIPAPILEAWRGFGRRGSDARSAWSDRLAAADDHARAEFQRRIDGDLPAGLASTVTDARATLVAEKPKVATRVASQNALEVLAPELPELMGGSADLTGSNNTRTKAFEMTAFSADSYDGNYVHYGIREHGMAAAMNGIALHGGLIPYGGTFLVFTDYLRPSLRLAALMGQRVIHVMTHDSIGLGEDGPTHQPVEHLAALRAMPNVFVFRPADAVETLECWYLALERRGGPSVLALTRQGLPVVREADVAGTDADFACRRGGYLLRKPAEDRQVTLMASGSEVEIALAAADLLEQEGWAVAVASMPCIELFDEQSDVYRKSVLGTAPRVAVEAALMMGWDRLVGPHGATVGMTGFGASAPADELYERFGITPAAVADAARAALRRAAK